MVQIYLASLYVSAIPTLIASGAAIPLGTWLVFTRPRVAKVVESVFNGLIGMPTVVLGLLLYLLLSPGGPLGWLNMLYTLEAIVIGHTLLVFPLITAFVISALREVDWRKYEALLTMGLDEREARGVIVGEALPGIVAAVMAGFNRAIGELGIALMLGGDIRFRTRVLTTAIVHETQLGNWETAIALGTLLIITSIILTLLISFLTPLARRFRG